MTCTKVQAKRKSVGTDLREGSYGATMIIEVRKIIETMKADWANLIQTETAYF